MRARLIMAALAAAAGLGFSQPAAAGWDDTHCCGGTVYIHHHVYYPPRYKHVYHIHRPGPRHVHVIHHADTCCVSYRPIHPRRNYFAPRAHYRWRAYHRHW